MKRTALTLSLYGTYGCLGYILTGLGAILPELRAHLQLPRAEAALYPSGFALGLIVVGLFGHRIADRFGRFGAPVALACLAAGAAVLAAGTGRLDSGIGALALGLGGAGLVLVVPTKLRAIHGDGDSGTVALSEANGVSSAAAVLAPLMVGMALGAGLGWRAGFAGIPLLAAVVVLVVMLVSIRQPASGGTEPSDEPGSTRAPRAFLGWWILLVLAVAVEFSLLFWAADFLRTAKALAAGLATSASAGLVLGMAVGRARAPRFACRADRCACCSAARWSRSPAYCCSGRRRCPCCRSPGWCSPASASRCCIR